MPFNRSNSVYDCPPECPKRSPICHLDCPIYAESIARDTELKAAARSRLKGGTDAMSVLIESRLHYKGLMK